jgi:ZIP family zinc transporter
MNWKNVVPAISTILFIMAVILGRQYQNLVIASIIGFVGMTFGAYLGRSLELSKPYLKAILYGVGSGMMIMSAFLIIAPKAMTGTEFESAVGGIGIAAGYMIGYSSHEISHFLTHRQNIQNLLYSVKVSEITAHSILAGTLMGVAYGTVPDLTLIFGFGVVAHKFPAGLTTVLSDKKDNTQLILIPATAVGISGVVAAFLIPSLSGMLRALIFGLSTGLFAHVSIDMTPECVSSNHNHSQNHGTIVCSTNIDRNRAISSASVLFGGVLITSLWFILI